MSSIPGATSLMATSQKASPKLHSTATAVSRTTADPSANEKSKNDVNGKLEMSKKTICLESGKKVEKQQQEKRQQPITNSTNIKSKNVTDCSPPSPCNGIQKQTPLLISKNKQSGGTGGAVEEASSTAPIGSNTNDILSLKDECDQSIVIKSEVALEMNNQPAQIVSNEDSENQNSTSSSEYSMFAKPHPLLLSSVNPHVVCNLCFGYLIDATTIVECLHSFCHSCLIKHLRTEQYCPRCEMMINTAKPNIKPDTTLQAIVYKLVPGLYERELMRKRAFYKDIPSDAALATPEQRGEDTEHLIFSPSDYMSLSLEYADKDEHINSNAEYAELLKPRYLQCPSMYTVAHLKKFVHGKFEIDANQFNIDIMYKVKTIVLLDHYTLMDVAYIYTWKRDAPMRFYFRVKESLRPFVKVRKAMPRAAKRQPQMRSKSDESPKLPPNAMTVIHEPSPSINSDIAAQMLPLAEIKVEHEVDCSSTTHQSAEEKCFEIVPQAESTGNGSSLKDGQSNTDKLKITLVSKSSKERQLNAEHKLHGPSRSSKEKRDSLTSTVGEHKDERKVENIKLKIDLSKQNSVTIINMSDPHRKEIVKPVKPEKEWKVKVKKEKSNSPKSSPNSERKSKTPSPLTVPPLTIKAERISPLAKPPPNSISVSPKTKQPPLINSEDEEKSQFLKSFALTPIKAIKSESPEKLKSFTVSSSLKNMKAPVAIKKETMKAPQNSILFKTPAPSKRKSKEPVKAIAKRPKMSPPLPPSDFKVKLSPSPIIATTSTATPVAASKTTTLGDKPLMPPPAPVSVMKPPIGIPKKATPKLNHKFAAPGSLTPHPMQGIQMAAPGNRTPIAKRYQPILPKGARPNPFANIPSGVNKILKDAGTEIKSIGNESNITKVYGPKTDSTSSMGPPPPHTSNQKTQQPSSGRGNASPSTNRSANANKLNNTNNYLNLALFNASKSKGNEAPPGCRTPMYTPNSPIYSPSSPQYVPNYNIPIMPTYKYTPKPNNANSSYLQNVLGSNSQMASLFPAPPTKKDTSSTQNPQKAALKTDSQLKRSYPFTRSPSPVEDPPEKQLKVKSLLNSCNINIPSSLSITITREDSESQSNNASYPKHKSPVNNYIEILKLPDQPADNTENNKRCSPPAVQKTNLPSAKKDSSDIKRTPSPQQLVPQKAATPSTQNVKHKQQQPQQTNGTTVSKSPVSIHAINVATTVTKPTTMSSSNAITVNSASNSNSECSTTTSSASTHQKPLQSTVTKSYNNPKSNQPTAQVEKKTPSPEKRSSQVSVNEHSSPSSGGETNKSPKSPNTSSDPSAKKFRHILPRQNPTPIPEVIPAKVTTASIIGTYSSPSGIAVKIHANKKVPPTKKSPNSQTHQQQQQQKPLPQLPNKSSQVQIASQSTTSKNNSPSLKVTSSLKSPPTVSQKQPFNNNNAAPKATSKSTTLSPPALPSPNTINNKVVPHSNSPTPSSLPPHSAMQAMSGLNNIPTHLAAAAAATSAAGQAELTKFFKDNLLRAHVQAAAASQSNMFYPYAANAAAAQMGQYAPSMYNNYQQAYIMEQLSRMHRAGNEAITEYMQKLKNGIDSKPTTTTPMSLSSPKSSSQPPASAPSPNTTTSKGHNATASKGK